MAAKNAYGDSYVHADSPPENHEDLDQKVFVIAAVISTIIAVALSTMFNSIPWVSLLTGLVSILIAMALRTVFKSMSAEWTGTPPHSTETEQLQQRCLSLERALKETESQLSSGKVEAAKMEAQRIAIVAMSKKIKNLEDEVKAARAGPDISKDGLEEKVKRALERADQEAEAARKAAGAAMAEAKQRKAEADVMRRKLEEAEEARRRGGEEVLRLERKVREMERSIAALMEEAEKAEKRRAEEEASLPARLRESEQRAASLQQATIAAATKVVRLEEEKKKEVEGLRRQLAAALAERTREQQEAQRTATKLAEQLAGLQQQAREAQRVTEKLQEEAKVRATLEEQVAEKIKENARLEARLVEVSNRRELLQREVDRLLALIKRLA